jgi:hypothetical protein
LACLVALEDEKDPMKRRYIRRLSDAAARQALEGLARGEDPGDVAHAELALNCGTSGPCAKMDGNSTVTDDGYACLTAAQRAYNEGDKATWRNAHERACRCNPTGAQIPVMGGTLACDGPGRPVERGHDLTLQVANEIRQCAECDPDRGPEACKREIARLRETDPDQARFVEARAERCLEE